jgi:hypothetical protein
MNANEIIKMGIKAAQSELNRGSVMAWANGFIRNVQNNGDIRVKVILVEMQLPIVEIGPIFYDNGNRANIVEVTNDVRFASIAMNEALTCQFNQDMVF